MVAIRPVQWSLALVAVAAVAGAFALMQYKEPQSGSRVSVTVAGTDIPVEVVDTELSREQGLSGRSALPPGSGMLFIFDQDGRWGIWMKDMRFSIDIVWLAADGTVITVAPDAAPDSYPVVFYPAAPARYVLELPVGFAAAHGIGSGARATIPK